jgi:hypothetical protein
MFLFLSHLLEVLKQKLAFTNLAVVLALVPLQRTLVHTLEPFEEY